MKSIRRVAPSTAPPNNEEAGVGVVRSALLPAKPERRNLAAMVNPAQTGSALGVTAAASPLVR
jgi:hypothetical protein